LEIRKDPTYIIREAAKDYYENYNRRESGWPTVITLHDYNHGPIVISGNVDLEMVPNFTCEILDT